MGKHSATVFAVNKNTEESVGEQCLLEVFKPDSEVCFSGSLLKNVAEVVPDEMVPKNDDQVPYSFIEPDYDNTCTDTYTTDIFQEISFKDTVHSEGLKYIAGYVAFRFRNKYNLGMSSSEMN